MHQFKKGISKKRYRTNHFNRFNANKPTLLNHNMLDSACSSNCNDLVLRPHLSMFTLPMDRRSSLSMLRLAHIVKKFKSSFPVKPLIKSKKGISPAIGSVLMVVVSVSCMILAISYCEGILDSNS